MANVLETLPRIIQGGMGVGVSDWRLARAVSASGQLGVVSGTSIDSVLIRRLQDGDPGGELRRAIAQFPLPHAAAATLRKYFIEGGRPPGMPYRLLPMWRTTVSTAREQLTMLASFVEVFLAKEGHDGEVGMNLLTKVQLPNLATLYGAMLAGVDYVIMGAGIPREIPGALDAFADGERATMKFEMEGLARGESEVVRFDPAAHWEGGAPSLRRPAFLPVIAADSLATMLMRKANGRIDGFVVEGPTAGGHNAPPRGKPEFNTRGEPVYGERDTVDLNAMRDLEVPFWLAGGMGSPAQLQAALDADAAGIQVGTLFAYAQESGLDAGLKQQVLEKVRAGTVHVKTDPVASPTGFPFKVVELELTNGDDATYDARTRICDLGYLRVAYRRPDGTIGYRCASEPIDTYVAKGGRAEDAVGRKCLCNGLMANIGLGQTRSDGPERGLVTSGDDLQEMARFTRGRLQYSAQDVIEYLLDSRHALQ